MSALLKAWSSLNWTAPCSVIACCAPAGAASTETTAAVAMRRALLTAQRIEASLAFLPGAADTTAAPRLVHGIPALRPRLPARPAARKAEERGGAGSCHDRVLPRHGGP